MLGKPSRRCVRLLSTRLATHRFFGALPSGLPTSFRRPAHAAHLLGLPTRPSAARWACQEPIACMQTLASGRRAAQLRPASGRAPWHAAWLPACCQPQCRAQLSRWRGQEPRRRPAPIAAACRYLAHFWRKGGGPANPPAHPPLCAPAFPVQILAPLSPTKAAPWTSTATRWVLPGPRTPGGAGALCEAHRA